MNLPRDIEWIVVDNASADNSRVAALALGAAVLALPRNKGFGGANNVGVAAARGDVLIFCNPDVAIDVEGVRALAERVRNHGGLWSPQLINVDGTQQENGRGVPSPLRKLRHMFSASHNSNDGYVRTARDGEIRNVIWTMGAAIAMSRDSFVALNGWDDAFFIYYEDSDICLRARKLGLATWLDGGVKWRHGWARETKNGVSLASWRHEIRSAFRFYRRHWYCIVPIGQFGRSLWRSDRLTRESGF